ncbi:MAG: type III-B CRISPR module-associated Cmr3 family protein, partial [Cyanobacteriota bacterium]|nr:type III-B CRISPR module-associated Cmr3 family protein [Cyanobacteriota bacterium]
DWQEGEKLLAFGKPESDRSIAYLLTPGLAPAEPDAPIYAAYPYNWGDRLAGCVTDRPLLWGGVSTIRRRLPNRANSTDKSDRGETEFALLPQRAFVPPGTVYHFKKDKQPEAEEVKLLLPKRSDSPPWLRTFEQLNYGILLWGKKKCQTIN